MFQASWLAQLAQSPSYAALRVATLQGAVNETALLMLAQDLQRWRPRALGDAQLPETDVLQRGAQAALHASCAGRRCAWRQPDGSVVLRIPDALRREDGALHEYAARAMAWRALQPPTPWAAVDLTAPDQLTFFAAAPPVAFETITAQVRAPRMELPVLRGLARQAHAQLGSWHDLLDERVGNPADAAQHHV